MITQYSRCSYLLNPLFSYLVVHILFDLSIIMNYLSKISKTLLGKWLWCFGVEKNAHLQKIIAVKYGTSQGYWCTTPVSSSDGAGLWKNISNSWTMFNKFVKFEVGTGNRIVFLKDVWWGGGRVF